MATFAKLLAGRDLRSIGESNSIVSAITDHNSFDMLFKCLFHHDRIVVMRAADAIEKVTIDKPFYLQRHKKEILELSKNVEAKELKWHLALLIPRLHLEQEELGWVWDLLTRWAHDKTNSRIVRVNSIQALFEIVKYEKELVNDFNLTLEELERGNIPSINARIRIIRKLQ